MSSLTAPPVPAHSTLADEALLALVLDATAPGDSAAVVRALLRLADEGDASALRLLLALAQEAAREAGEREGLSRQEAALVGSHVLQALGRELRGGAETAAAAGAWLVALAVAGARARAAA